jgi:hypothetical protein
MHVPAGADEHNHLAVAGAVDPTARWWNQLPAAAVAAGDAGLLLMDPKLVNDPDLGLVEADMHAFLELEARGLVEPARGSRFADWLAGLDHRGRNIMPWLLILVVLVVVVLLVRFH